MKRLVRLGLLLMAGSGALPACRRSKADSAIPRHRSFVVCTRTTDNQRPNQEVVVNGGQDPAQEGFHKHGNVWCTNPFELETEGSALGVHARIRVYGYNLNRVAVRYAQPGADGRAVVRENLLVRDATDYYQACIDLPPSTSEVPVITPGFVADPDQTLMP